MFGRLLAFSGPLSGTAVTLAGVEIAVGRDEANEVVLADLAVSMRHCVLLATGSGLTVRDLDPANPTFVNGLPADGRTLADGDQIQIGESSFILTVAAGPDGPSELVTVSDAAGTAPYSIVMRREEVFGGSAAADAVGGRLGRDLDALVRISSAINAIRGLVALERPVIELIADVLPAARGAMIFARDGAAEITSATGWKRERDAGPSVQVNRQLIERVLRDAVGILTRSVLAAPLVAFDRPLGAIVFERDDAEEPFDEGHLRLLMAIGGVAGTALAHTRQVESLEDSNRLLRAQLNVTHSMVGDSPAMRDVYRRVGRVAVSDSTVLITGESGTGKELVARAIHRNSARAAQPFVAINCAAITETLLESELFGHEKGAFTGAIAQKKGKLETADGGTVFLDEIGELSPALQAKLLRVLQDREFDRVGGTRAVRVDFRLLAATNRDLEAAIADGKFRRDLYYRLNVVSLALPPLRERRADIPLLAHSFVRRHADKGKRRVAGFSPEALASLASYDWPGNVRELENAIEHAVVLGTDTLILRDDLPDAVAESGPTATSSASTSTTPTNFHDAVKQFKKDLIIRAVGDAHGNYNAAARLLGLHPNYLHRLIKNLDLKSALK